jgi:hypothetical protein
MVNFPLGSAVRQEPTVLGCAQGEEVSAQGAQT